MEALNTFLTLISKTQGRDKFLRFIQYATVHSLAHQAKGPAYNVYKQMRMTRKLLRFLRTLQYSTKIRQEAIQLINNLGSPILIILKHLSNILQNLFNLLFFLSDHRVCLGQLDILSKQTAASHFPKSMKYYFLQNLMGVIHSILRMIIVMKDGGEDRNQQKVKKAIEKISFNLVRCVLDCFVALFYWKNKFSPKTTGIIGVISSIMAIMQSVEMM